MIPQAVDGRAPGAVAHRTLRHAERVALAFLVVEAVIGTRISESPRVLLALVAGIALVRTLVVLLAGRWVRRHRTS